jgi:hypothetical protein
MHPSALGLHHPSIILYYYICNKHKQNHIMLQCDDRQWLRENMAAVLDFLQVSQPGMANIAVRQCHAAVTAGCKRLAQHIMCGDDPKHPVQSLFILAGPAIGAVSVQSVAAISLVT